MSDETRHVGPCSGCTAVDGPPGPRDQAELEAETQHLRERHAAELARLEASGAASQACLDQLANPNADAAVTWDAEAALSAGAPSARSRAPQLLKMRRGRGERGVNVCRRLWKRKHSWKRCCTSSL